MGAPLIPVTLFMHFMNQNSHSNEELHCKLEFTSGYSFTKYSGGDRRYDVDGENTSVERYSCSKKRSTLSNSRNGNETKIIVSKYVNEGFPQLLTKEHHRIDFSAAVFNSLECCSSSCCWLTSSFFASFFITLDPAVNYMIS